MKRGALALYACAALAVACTSLQVALAASNGGAVIEPDRLRAAAAALAADAARAEESKSAIRLASVPQLSQDQNAGLQRWMSGQLTAINHEKQSRTQANDLRTLAATLRRLAGAGLSAVSPARSPRVVAQEVLSGRAYQFTDSGQPGPPHESLWERIATFFGKLLARIFSGIFGAGTSSPIVGQVVAILLVALLVVAIAFLAYRIVDALTRRRRPTRFDDSIPLPERIDPDFFYRAGVEAADHGHYAQAVALLFQASLAWLDRQGTFAFDPSLTPAEYRRVVRRNAERASPHFDELAHAFVMAAFAERPVSPDDWAKADAAYAQMRTAVAG
jgi:hypothetical protein